MTVGSRTPWDGQVCLCEIDPLVPTNSCALTIKTELPVPPLKPWFEQTAVTRITGKLEQSDVNLR